MKENRSLPVDLRWKRVNDDLLAGGKSRLWHIGQFLMSVGLAVLCLAGTAWLLSQIF